MPCNSSDGMADAYRTDPDAQRQVRELRQKNDDLTRMLCSLLRALEDHMIVPQDVAEWYHQHQEWDRSQGRSR